MVSTKKILMFTIWSSVIFCAAIIVLFESHLLKTGFLADDTQLLFILSTVMQLLTICIIPVALRLFKFKAISQRLTTGAEEMRAQQLRKWGLVRLDMLILPMQLNLLAYYLTDVVGFAYMAIILALSLFFVYPSMDRCLRECALIESTPNS